MNPSNPNQNRSNGDRSIDELRQESAASRARVADDLETLGRKVSPANLKLEAKEAVRDAGRAAVHGVKERAEQAAETGKRAGRSAVEFVRHNPVPLGLIAAGVGMLVYSSKTDSARFETPRLGNRLSELESDASRKLGQARATASAWGHSASEKAQAATHEVVSIYENQPLAVAAAAVAAGAVIGLMLPSTQREDRALGQARDRLADQAKEFVRDGLHAAERELSSAATHLGQTVRERS